jgi:hypothetical protein
VEASLWFLLQRDVWLLGGNGSACAMLVSSTWVVRSACGMLVSTSGCAFCDFARISGNGVSDHRANADEMGL